MSEGHTPGKWEAVLYPSGWNIRTVYVDSASGMRTTAWPATIDCGGQPNEANARLISAAPDMLEALKEIVRTEVVEYLVHPEQFDAINMARAALAKAEGRD